MQLDEEVNSFKLIISKALQAIRTSLATRWDRCCRKREASCKFKTVSLYSVHLYINLKSPLSGLFQWCSSLLCKVPDVLPPHQCWGDVGQIFQRCCVFTLPQCGAMTQRAAYLGSVSVEQEKWHLHYYRVQLFHIYSKAKGCLPFSQLHMEILCVDQIQLSCRLISLIKKWVRLFAPYTDGACKAYDRAPQKSFLAATSPSGFLLPAIDFQLWACSSVMSSWTDTFSPCFWLC